MKRGPVCPTAFTALVSDAITAQTVGFDGAIHWPSFGFDPGKSRLSDCYWELMLGNSSCRACPPAPFSEQIELCAHTAKAYAIAKFQPERLGTGGGAGLCSFVPTGAKQARPSMTFCIWKVPTHHRGRFLHQVQMSPQTPCSSSQHDCPATPSQSGAVPLSGKKCAKSTFIRHTLLLEIGMYHRQAFIGQFH